MAVRWRRVFGQREGVRQFFPSNEAQRAETPSNGALHNEGRGPDAELFAIHCKQCNATIPDWRKLKACWFCESDNFIEGVNLPPLRE